MVVTELVSKFSAGFGLSAQKFEAMCGGTLYLLCAKRTYCNKRTITWVFELQV